MAEYSIPSSRPWIIKNITPEDVFDAILNESEMERWTDGNGQIAARRGAPYLMIFSGRRYTGKIERIHGNEGIEMTFKLEEAAGRWDKPAKIIWKFDRMQEAHDVRIFVDVEDIPDGEWDEVDTLFRKKIIPQLTKYLEKKAAKAA